MNLGNRGMDGLLTPIGDIKESLRKENAFCTIGGQGDNNFRMDAFVVNQNNLLLEILKTASSFNKGKKKYLSVFIKGYIDKLTIDQDNALLSKLYYYLEVYELDTPMGNDNLDNNILIDCNSYSKSEILGELLFNNIYLPEYTNQKDFNKDMLALLDKVEGRINKYRQKRNPVVFPPVFAGKIITYMEDTRSNIVQGVKYLDKGVIKNIGYKFALNERSDAGLENEFFINFSIDLQSSNGFSREEYIRHITDDLGKKSLLDELNYFYAEDNNFRYSVYVGETFFDRKGDIDDDGFTHDFQEKDFEIKIHAESKHSYNPEDTLNNVCLRLPALAEQIITDIYETYGRDSKGETGYPTKRETFNINNLLNSEEDKGGNFNDLGNSLINATGGDKEGNRKNVLQEWNMSAKEQTELLIDSKTEETVNVFIDQIKNPEKYKKIGITKMPTGAMFFGPGGVGKSELCKKIGFETKGLTNFYYLNLSELFNKFLGESEKNIESIFQRLRLEFETTGKFGLLFIDEIDGLISNDSSEALSGIRSKLLSELSEGDNEGIIVLGTTNFPEKLSGPILRRFSEKVGISLPNKDLISKLFNLNMSKYNISIFDDNLDISKLVDNSVGLSHDFINQWVFNTVRYSVTLLKDGDKIDYNFFMKFFERTKDIIDGESKKMGFNTK